MRVIKDTQMIAEMMEKTGYQLYVDIEKVEPDEHLDVIANCCIFFEEKSEDIQRVLGLKLDVIMYSWFYWGELFLATLGVKKRKSYGDGSIIDYILRIPEDIEHSGLEDPDFDFMETLSNEINDMTNGGLLTFYDM